MNHEKENHQLRAALDEIQNPSKENFPMTAEKAVSIAREALRDTARLHDGEGK